MVSQMSRRLAALPGLVGSLRPCTAASSSASTVATDASDSEAKTMVLTEAESVIGDPVCENVAFTGHGTSGGSGSTMSLGTDLRLALAGACAVTAALVAAATQQIVHEREAVAAMCLCHAAQCGAINAAF